MKGPDGDVRPFFMRGQQAASQMLDGAHADVVRLFPYSPIVGSPVQPLHRRAENGRLTPHIETD